MRRGWLLLETLAAMAVFSMVITASLASLKSLQQHAALRQLHEDARLEAENVAEWISVAARDEQLTTEEDVELPDFFPSSPATAELPNAKLAVKHFDESNETLQFTRFEITITFDVLPSQSSEVNLTVWRAW